MTTILIRAEDARRRVDEKKQSRDNLMRIARNEIARDIERAVEDMNDSIRIACCWVQRWPEEIWKELEDFGYTVVRENDGNIMVKW